MSGSFFDCCSVVASIEFLTFIDKIGGAIGFIGEYFSSPKIHFLFLVL